MLRAAGPPPAAPGVTAITSTWSPGWIRLPTPFTRSTGIETPRMPRGMRVPSVALTVATTFDDVTVPPAGTEDGRDASDRGCRVGERVGLDGVAGAHRRR